MYCKVHRPVNTPGVSDNKGKCVQLVEYLSKELKEERSYYDNFFSQKEDYVTPLTVMHHMDNNHRTLKRNDDKFYMLTINPSGEEQQHLIEKVTGKKTGEFSELSPEQQKEVLAEMKRLTRECMDEYACNFYREKIRSGDDLVWYGRVETERHYKGDDVTRNFAASLFRNIKYFTLRKLYLCRKWMQKRLQKTTTTGITLPNFDFLA